jgi:hypothetical protein
MDFLLGNRVATKNLDLPWDHRTCNQYPLHTEVQMESSPFALPGCTSHERHTARMLPMSSSSSAQVTAGHPLISRSQARRKLHNTRPGRHNRFPVLLHTSLAAWPYYRHLFPHHVLLATVQKYLLYIYTHTYTPTLLQRERRPILVSSLSW